MFERMNLSGAENRIMELTGLGYCDTVNELAVHVGEQGAECCVLVSKITGHSVLDVMMNTHVGSSDMYQEDSTLFDVPLPFDVEMSDTVHVSPCGDMYRLTGVHHSTERNECVCEVTRKRPNHD